MTRLTFRDAGRGRGKEENERGRRKKRSQVAKNGPRSTRRRHVTRFSVLLQQKLSPKDDSGSWIKCVKIWLVHSHMLLYIDMTKCSTFLGRCRYKRRQSWSRWPLGCLVWLHLASLSRLFPSFYCTLQQVGGKLFQSRKKREKKKKTFLYNKSCSERGKKGWGRIQMRVRSRLRLSSRVKPSRRWRLLSIVLSPPLISRGFFPPSLSFSSFSHSRGSGKYALIIRAVATL